ncbi:hypothetical protein [Candidatus Sulfurimonas baltica]|uniref:Transformation system protein n=1 Tax=Candidatus Sulfurimonas baltica TaxID=2740404 RepID=A0A7S7LWL4_9BACT|nr:hypothetical protein [Candidatus Sulfurimonas baltica]QOY52816.1 hypothetical protein HUE88_03775 [Candidatus Sulfurimonas baltica]
MLNIKDLEARHTKYRLKSYIPHVAIAISTIAILISIVTIFNYSSIANIDEKNITKENNRAVEYVQAKEIVEILPTVINDNSVKETPLVKTVEATKQSSKEKVLITEKEVKDKMLLSPSLNFMRKMQTETVEDYKNENNKAEPESKQLPKNKKIEKIEKVKINKVESNTISIKKQDIYSDIDHVIQRFKINNNPALSLFVAKKYYQIGEYEKAYNYALITNGINNNIEASWIIFTKALIKLDKREMAIETLKKYLNHSSSSQAKILLDEILSGKFK